MDLAQIKIPKAHPATIIIIVSIMIHLGIHNVSGITSEEEVDDYSDDFSHFASVWEWPKCWKRTAEISD